MPRFEDDLQSVEFDGCVLRRDSPSAKQARDIEAAQAVSGAVKTDEEPAPVAQDFATYLATADWFGRLVVSGMHACPVAVCTMTALALAL
jgi:hypothetical protein